MLGLAINYNVRFRSKWGDALILCDSMHVAMYTDYARMCCRAFTNPFWTPLQVLSVNKALSIQAHPDKARAELLHAKVTNATHSHVVTSSLSLCHVHVPLATLSRSCAVPHTPFTHTHTH